MSAFSDLVRIIELSSTDELERTVRILHVAGQAPDRLLGAWAVPTSNPVRPGFPPLFAALCCEIGLEFVARGARMHPCGPCNHQIESLATGPVADSSTPPASVGSSLPEGARTEALT